LQLDLNIFERKKLARNTSWASILLSSWRCST